MVSSLFSSTCLSPLRQPPPLYLFLIPLRVSLFPPPHPFVVRLQLSFSQSIMSEPTTTAAVPKPEDKQTEVTPAVEPSSETPAPAPVCRLTISPASFILTVIRF